MATRRITWPAAFALAAGLALAQRAPAQPGEGVEGILGVGRESAGAGASRSADEPSGDEATDMQSEAYVRRPALNEGLPPLDSPPDLETPRASLANFIDSCERGDFGRAACSMNLNDLPIDRQAELGPLLAARLFAVLEQKLWINWADVPDRPDGQQFGYNLDRARGDGDDRPRPFHHLGSIGLGRRDADVYLERVKVPDEAPSWVISRRTVSQIPALHEAYRSGPLERRLPSRLREAKLWGIALWQWVGIAAFGLISLAIGRVSQEVVERILRGQASRRVSDWFRALAWSVHGPVAAIVGLASFKLLASQFLRLAGPVMAIVEPIIFVLIVLSAAWLLSRVIEFATSRLSGRYEGEEHAANSHEMLTRIKVAKHFFTSVVLLGGLAVALWQFEWFQAIGYGLLASAGIAALVLGLAAQRPLGNLFAGVQLALTQPVRVGDAVIYAGEWGWIEEIAVTYVVIRTWDLRRLVVPTAQLMDNTVENWTKGGENMMKPVYLYADYRVDVAAVREEFERILKDSDDWDEQVPPVLQVTGCSQETVELRALCSAKDPPTAWNLHCEVRERLVAFLQRLEGGSFLPRTRVAVVGDGGPSPADDLGEGGEEQGSGRRGDGRRRSRSRDRKGRFRPRSGTDDARAKAHAAEVADRNRIGGSPGDGRGGDGEGEGGDGEGDGGK